MIKLFQIFFSKTLLIVYSATLILTFLLGCVNMYNVNQQSEEFSTAFLFFSIFLYFVLLIVLESNRIYQFFRTTDFRLLPISTWKLYIYNLFYSVLVGSVFFIGNAIVGVIINYTLINIPFVLNTTWIKGILAFIDTIVLFLMVQFLVCIYAASKQFIQKRFRWVLELALLIIFTLLIDHLSVLDLGVMKDFIMKSLGLEQEVYYRLISQLVMAVGYFSLSTWLIERYVEAGDQ